MSAGDLFYAGDDRDYAKTFEASVLSEFPSAKMSAHNDGIKGWRVEIDIPSDEDGQDSFWRFAIREGYALDLLGFQLEMRMEPDHVRELMAAEGVPVPVPSSTQEPT